MSDIVERLLDLHKQATKERSHYYVGSLCKEAVAEIERLQKACRDQAGVELSEENDRLIDENKRLRATIKDLETSLDAPCPHCGEKP